MVAESFKVVENRRGERDFELNAAWTADSRHAFDASGADGLIANYARGFAGHDLRFVEGLPLRRLDVLARTIDDLTPIHELGETLEELSVQTGSGSRVDLRRLPVLRRLSCAWGLVADTIDGADTLSDLFLMAYDATDLTPLAHLRDLQALRMKDRPRLRQLTGVEGLTRLAQLGVYSAPLNDITALTRLNSAVLRHLAFGGCRDVNDLQAVAACVALTILDVSEAGALTSLLPIAVLTGLERLHLYGSTRVVDGDLTPLLGLRQLHDLRIMNRRHYVPSVASVKGQLGLNQ